MFTNSKAFTDGTHWIMLVSLESEEVLERIIIPEVAYFDYPNRDIFV